MNIGYWSPRPLDNLTAQGHGASHRHPLLAELNRRGHRIYYERADRGIVPSDDTTALDGFGRAFRHECYRFRDDLPFTVSETEHDPFESSALIETILDAVIVEYPPDGSPSADRIIDDCAETETTCFVFDPHDSARHLDADRKAASVLMRPYRDDREGWQREHYHPYPYAPDYWPDLNRTPLYDVVSVGNRDDVGVEFVELFDGLSDLDVLLVGEWDGSEFDAVDVTPDIAPSAPAYATIPLLQQGQITIHAGTKRSRGTGHFPPRMVEAALAKRPCGVHHDHAHLDWCDPQFILHGPADVRQLVERAARDRRCDARYRESLWTREIDAATTLLEGSLLSHEF